MIDKLMTVEEVAEYLRVHPITVRIKIKEGKLKAVRLGPRSIRIEKSELDKYIKAIRQTVRKE